MVFMVFYKIFNAILLSGIKYSLFDSVVKHNKEMKMGDVFVVQNTTNAVENIGNVQ